MINPEMGGGYGVARHDETAFRPLSKFDNSILELARAVAFNSSAL